MWPISKMTALFRYRDSAVRSYCRHNEFRSPETGKQNAVKQKVFNQSSFKTLARRQCGSVLNTSIMANVSGSAIVGEASGKVGDKVFGRNRYGKFVRSKGVQPNTPTSARTQRRNALSSTQTRWQNLTENQRELWIKAAEEGIFKVSQGMNAGAKLSGASLFMKVNLKVWPYNLTMDEPQPLRSIPTANIPTPTLLTVTPPNSVQITLSAAALFPDTLCAIYTTGTISQGIMRPKDSLFKRIYDGIVGSYGSFLEIGPQVVGKHGSLVSGKKMFARVDFVDLETGDSWITGQVVDLT